MRESEERENEPNQIKLLVKIFTQIWKNQKVRIGDGLIYIERVLPELSGFGLALVEKGLLDIVSGVKLRWLLGGGGLRRLLVVTRENAAVLGLDGPQTPLVIHLRPRKLPHTTDQIWVSAHLCGLL